MSPANPVQSAAKPEEDEEDNVALKARMIVLILALAAAAIIIFGAYSGKDTSGWIKVSAVVVLSLFLPLLAYSYFFFRRGRREAEVDRIIAKLEFEDERKYIEMFRRIRAGPYFILAAGIAWVIALAGLMVLFLGEKIEIQPIPISTDEDLTFPKTGSRLVFGMAFLGAYFWGLQYTFRRYVLNDLIPGVFYSLSIRMLVASTLALVIFNAFEGGDSTDSGQELISAAAWPALAFLLGAFPQRGLQWLLARLPIFSDRPDASVRPLPLEMIEGMQTYDRMRLEELGIDDCHNLASYDFIPLVLKTSYGARELTDWIMQAKLCVCCGEAVKDLRQHGVRGLLDLEDFDEEAIVKLAKETSATESSLRQAKGIIDKDPEIRRLRRVAGQLSEYT